MGSEFYVFMSKNLVQNIYKETGNIETEYFTISKSTFESLPYDFDSIYDNRKELGEGICTDTESAIPYDIDSVCNFHFNDIKNENDIIKIQNALSKYCETFYVSYFNDFPDFVNIVITNSGYHCELANGDVLEYGNTNNNSLSIKEDFYYTSYNGE